MLIPADVSCCRPSPVSGHGSSAWTRPHSLTTCISWRRIISSCWHLATTVRQLCKLKRETPRVNEDNFWIYYFVICLSVSIICLFAYLQVLVMSLGDLGIFSGRHSCLFRKCNYLISHVISVIWSARLCNVLTMCWFSHGRIASSNNQVETKRGMFLAHSCREKTNTRSTSNNGFLRFGYVSIICFVCLQTFYRLNRLTSEVFIQYICKLISTWSFPFSFSASFRSHWTDPWW